MHSGMVRSQDALRTSWPTSIMIITVALPKDGLMALFIVLLSLLASLQSVSPSIPCNLPLKIIFIYLCFDWLNKVVFTFNASEPRRYIHPLELDTEYVIQGVKVTLLEANHCPGAALLHLRLPTGLCYLHTGDFRASKLTQAHPLLAKNRVNVLYLDTTYCNPKYK